MKVYPRCFCSLRPYQRSLPLLRVLFLIPVMFREGMMWVMSYYKSLCHPERSEGSLKRDYRDDNDLSGRFFSSFRMTLWGTPPTSLRPIALRVLFLIPALLFCCPRSSRCFDYAQHDICAYPAHLTTPIALRVLFLIPAVLFLLSSPSQMLRLRSA